MKYSRWVAISEMKPLYGTCSSSLLDGMALNSVKYNYVKNWTNCIDKHVTSLKSNEYKFVYVYKI